MKKLILLIAILMCTGCSNSEQNDSAVTDYQSADYWIQKLDNPAPIIMTEDKIKHFNETCFDELGEDYLMDLSRFNDHISGQEIRTWIESYQIPTDPIFDLQGQEMTEENWNAVKANMNMDDISDTPSIQWGICTVRSNIKSFPIETVLTDDPESTDDLFQETALLFNEPVVILHTSTDKIWSYIAMYNYRGWVKTEDVAICKDYKEWTQLQDMPESL
ncbi:MAG: SH3 domain-containing protein [Lachnospiraceae bacterium]|nr:SH3 domain-containing protein [Lachnospiraceae bacterium]